MSRRKKQEVDVSRFAPLVEEALKAFATRFIYAEAMLNRADATQRKRDAHAAWRAERSKGSGPSA